MSAHTPGPWRIAEGREAPDRKHRFIWSDAETREEREDSSPYCVATVHERTFCKQLDANARLIAAAPEIGVLLRQVMDNVSLPDYLILPISAALAKAGL